MRRLGKMPSFAHYPASFRTGDFHSMYSLPDQPHFQVSLRLQLVFVDGNEMFVAGLN
jgi:hypothetical protein